MCRFLFLFLLVFFCSDVGAPHVCANGESKTELISGETVRLRYVTIRTGMTFKEVLAASGSPCSAMTFVGNGFVVQFTDQLECGLSCDTDGRIKEILDSSGRRIESGVIRILIKPMQGRDKP